MKTRQGFVSNSSSSSFILNFTRHPGISNIREELFGEQKKIELNDLVTVPTMIIAEVIAMKQYQWPRQVKEIKEDKEFLENLYSYGTEKIFLDIIQKFKYKDEGWILAEHTSVKRGKEFVDNFLASLDPESFILVVTFEDHGYLGRRLESGELFQAVPHFSASHH